MIHSKRRHRGDRISGEQLERRIVLAAVSFISQPPIVSSDHAGASQVIMADMDGDLDLDLVTASTLDDRIAWYENLDGAATFGAQRIVTQEALGVEMIHVADLDGDGDLDLAAIQSAHDRVSWYENLDGAGNFGEENVVTESAILGSAVTAADIDGDNDLDLVSASFDVYDSDVSWYENLDGQGNFGSQQVTTSDLSGPLSVVAGDVDGDGDADLVVASYYDDRVTWLENQDAMGGFAEPQPITALTRASAVSLADLDGDGDLDVVSGNSDYYSLPNVVVWSPNDGLGGFDEARVISSQVDGVTDLDPVDFDGDGDVDLISSSVYDGTVLWFENANGQGTFTEHLVAAGGNDVTSVAVGDLDDDGDQDVAFASFLDDVVAWVPQNEFAFGAPVIISEFGVLGADAVVPIDFDLDGDQDLAAVGVLDGTVNLIENLNGAGQWGEKQVIDFGLIGAIDIEAADLNGDNALDLLIAVSTTHEVFWYTNDGSGSFSSRRVVGTELFATEAVAVGDVDGDGDLDVLATATGYDEYPSGVFWFENTNGKGAFSPANSIDNTLQRPREVSAVDLDGDDDLDLAVISWGDGSLSWFENTDGQGTFDIRHTVSDQLGLPVTMTSGDLDGDGDTDLLTAGFLDNRVYWFENDGSGEFTEHVIASPGSAGPESVELSDLDGDGDLDVLVATVVEDDLVWFENLDGVGTFGDLQFIDDRVFGASEIVAVDVDGDGASDVVAASYDRSRLLWYRNDTRRAADFNSDGQLDVRDVDLLCAAIQSDENRAEFDLTGEGLVNSSDLNRMVFDLLGSTIGDANRDGVFDSSDLVLVFSAGQYEDGVTANSGWGEGDWNCDGEFNTSDLVAAFSQGDYRS